jgi:hypothetical protein
LRQFDLKLTFSGPGVSGKNVQDQLGAIHDSSGQRTLKISQLGGAEVVIEENNGSARGLGNGGNLFNLALSHERRRIEA